MKIGPISSAVKLDYHPRAIFIAISIPRGTPYLPRIGNGLGDYGPLSFPSIILSSGNTVSHVLCHHADYFMILYLLLAMYRYPNGSCHFNGAK